MKLKAFEFIQRELEKYGQISPNDKMVTNRFMTSLVYEPLVYGRDKSLERMKVMSGDTVS